MNRMGAQAGGDITSATTEVAKQIASTNVDFSTNEVGVDAKLDIKDTLQNVQTPQLPELQAYLDAKFDDQVQQALNNDIEGSLTQEFTKIDSDAISASKAFEATRKTEIDKAVQDAETASSDAAKEQAKAISDAEKDIDTEKKSAEAERSKLTDDIYKEIKGEQGEQRSMIEGKLKSVGRDIDGKFEAETKNQTNFEQTQKEAEAEKKKAQNDDSWWPLKKRRMSSPKHSKNCRFLSTLYQSPRTNQQGHRYRSNLGKEPHRSSNHLDKDQLDTFKGCKAKSMIVGREIP